ncbi:MAG: J domain-containing protein [Candidatus Saccharimonadales bacterium]
MSSQGRKSFTDYYALLGVPPTASSGVIRTAYLKAAKSSHPDAGGSAEAMQALNKAYETLRSDKSRRAYNLMHGFSRQHDTAEFAETPYAGTRSETDDMTEDEIDDFVQSMFTEYSVKPAKEPLLTKAKHVIRLKKK